MTLANNFNFMCDGPDSLSRFPKKFEFESSYDVISPRALQQSKVAEDHEPNQFLKSVLAEGFFSETSASTLLEPQPAAPTVAVEDHGRRSTASQMSGTKEICAQPLMRKDVILDALKNETLSEGDVLCRVGDSQYNRHLLRQLVRSGLIQRVGKGGLKDPFRYHAQQISQ
jgi:hypothetical protein